MQRLIVYLFSGTARYFDINHMEKPEGYENQMD